MPDWRPCDTSVHGERLRIFTDEEENALVEFIVDNFFTLVWRFTTPTSNF